MQAERLDSIAEAVSRAERERDVCRGRLEDLGEALEQSGERAKALDRLHAVFQDAAAGVERSAHARITRIVGMCLSAVFDEPYEFDILFEAKRGKTEARLVFKRNGMVIGSPMDASGGGVLDVASFALRLASVVLSLPRKRRILILDEPFRFVSERYRPRVAELLERVAVEHGVQIVMVTHVREFRIGRVVEA